MSVCPNCGAFSVGGKFCENCGAALPVEAPQPQQAQPVQSQEQQAQPVRAIPVQPVYDQQPGPIYQQPVQTEYQQPVYHQPGYSQSVPVQPAYSQSALPKAAKQTTNGACIAGFILGLVGIFTFGITSIFGFIVSIIGIIIAFAKKQKGKVLGIIGLILSIIMITLGIVLLANLDNIFEGFEEAWEEESGGKSFEEYLYDDSYSDKLEYITGTDWIETDDGSYLVFVNDMDFRYYTDYRVLDNNYFTGTYELYIGTEAIDAISQDYTQYGYTEDDVTDKIQEERGIALNEFVVLVLKNNGYWTDGVNTRDSRWDRVYMGYYAKGSSKLELFCLDDNKDHIFADFSGFNTSRLNMPELETTAVPGDDYMGDSITGTVHLYQGEWADWNEADNMGSYFLSRVQKFNVDTATIIQLSVFSGQYNESYAEEIIEVSREDMESQGADTSEVKKTTIGGYEAYTVTGLYDNGEYLTVWYFVDEDLHLHYISVEYFEDDTASYEMVRDTYSFDG